MAIDTALLAEQLCPLARESMVRLRPRIMADMPVGRGLGVGLFWAVLLRWVLPWAIRVVIEHLFLQARNRDPMATEYLRAAGTPYTALAAQGFLPEVLAVSGNGFPPPD
jgi:hypothetical protein